MNHMTHPLSFGSISIFYIKKYRYRLRFDAQFLILLTFVGSLKIALINMVTILMMSAKMAALALLKIKVFFKKGYDAIISVDEVSNKFLSGDSNFIVNVIMRSEFDNSSISVKVVIMTTIL